MAPNFMDDFAVSETKVDRKTRKVLFWTIDNKKDGFRFMFNCMGESLWKKDKMGVVYSK